jgi:NitT/TauT family transport system substrate-binding protein
MDIQRDPRRHDRWNRRWFLHGLSLTGTAGLVGAPRRGYAEPPPETTRLRLSQIAGICIAPQYVADELLRAEGFSDIQYVQIEATNPYPAFAAGNIDVSMAFVAPFLLQLDTGVPVVLLGGVHVGCFELFGTDRVRAIRDLKGRSVGVPALGSPHYLFLASMASYVGLDPRKDITWLSHPPGESAQRLGEGKIDALMGFPPVPQELRAKGIGHVVVNSAVDRPWSQYFCCVLAANREFARRHPVATKRALRAILKATDICAVEPERAARLIVDRGFTKDYGYALQTMKEIPYNRWRQYDPEDTVRFYALRLHEAGMIKSPPQKLIAQGTDWRFLNELRRELKG